MSTEDLIENALTSGSAFVLPPPPKEQPVETVSAPPPAASVAPESEAPAASAETPEVDTWKQDYDAQVEAWRVLSAEAREKSEKEREKWEAIRKEEKAQRRASGLPELEEDIPTGLPTHKPTPSIDVTLKTVESSIVDIRPDTPESRQDTNDKWEEVQASTSTLPSMTFPERASTPSSAPTPPPQPVQLSSPPTATLSVFDSTLSTRTRILAGLSALAINLALPFINGVMLGFGEIFAKNVVLEWFGWRKTTVASNVGIGAQRKR